MPLSFEEAHEQRRVIRQKEFEEYAEIANHVKDYLIKYIDEKMIENYDQDKFSIFFEKDDFIYIKVGLNIHVIKYYDFINYLFHSLRDLYEAKNVRLQLFYRESYTPNFFMWLVGRSPIKAAWYLVVERDY